MSDDFKDGFELTDVAQLANQKAKGKRPEYFGDTMSENHFTITMALVAELAVARERIDTLERVLADKGLIEASDVESFEPNQKAGQERQLAQLEYSSRIFRGLQQSLQQSSEHHKSMDEMAEILGKTDDQD